MSGQPSDNPYAAPQEILQPADLPQAYEAYPYAPPTSGSNVIAGWIIVFCLNLPLPTLLGLALCRIPGALGVLVAVAGMLSLTTYVFHHAGRFANYWLWGAVCVALSQFLPYLHFLLGFFATRLFAGPELHFFPAMICTAIVGGGLLGVSLAFGLFFYLLFWAGNERGGRNE